MAVNEITRVMVVDDHLVVRRGFAVMLSAFPELELVGEASNGREAVTKAVNLQPDVVLMDMMMPEMTGPEAIRAILSTCPQIAFVALTSFSQDQQLLQEALDAGALGYLFKDVSAADLVRAIDQVRHGLTVLAPEATRMLIQPKMQRSPDEFHFSDREFEVLRLLGKGMSNQEIAETLSVSLSTVKFHVSGLLGKLGASSRAEAITIAHQHKLIS